MYVDDDACLTCSIGSSKCKAQVAHFLVALGRGWLIMGLHSGLYVVASNCALDRSGEKQMMGGVTLAHLITASERTQGRPVCGMDSSEDNDLKSSPPPPRGLSSSHSAVLGPCL